MIINSEDSKDYLDIEDEEYNDKNLNNFKDKIIII